jgi:type I restriction enzyme M protein
MATGTNTVVLFLRRRSNYDASYIEEAIRTFFTNHRDNTINGIESPFSKYVSHVWQSLTLDDYIHFISGELSEAVKNHEIYTDYQKKFKVKNEKELREQISVLEREKMLYFFLTYNQEIVLVKSGEKNEEKNFLGYEFSNRK